MKLNPFALFMLAAAVAVARGQDPNDPSAKQLKPPDGWKYVTGKDGSYQFLFPEKTKSSGSREQSSNRRGLSSRAQINYCELADGTKLAFSVEKLSGPALKNLKISDVYNSLVDSLKENGFALSEPKEFALAGQKGREYFLTKDPIVQRKILLILRDGRVFDLMVTAADKDTVTSATADTFLKSLVLVAKPATPPTRPKPAQGETQAHKAETLTEARKGFKTQLLRREITKEPVPEPPPKLFRTVRYQSPVGKLAAYLTPDPKDGKKHPAIIWITGGDCNSIDEGCWKEGQPSDDQSASAFRKAGIVMMFPSLRGGNDNPGIKEGFFGEVDDVLAAADFLAKQEYVDSGRIYLGGHSTGGTLVLLVAECTDRFRAIFSFGPAEDVSGYEPEYTPFKRSARELELRSPLRWLASIKTPTFVFEGTVEGNLAALRALARASTNPNAHFLPVRGANHFSILAPATRLIAGKILRDDGPASNLAFTEEETGKLLVK